MSQPAASSCSDQTHARMVGMRACAGARRNNTDELRRTKWVLLRTNNRVETFCRENPNPLFGAFPRWAPLGQLRTSEPPIGGRP